MTTATVALLAALHGKQRLGSGARFSGHETAD
jgi:hypothetical protein